MIANDLIESARKNASEIMTRRADDKDIVLLASAVHSLCDAVMDIDGCLDGKIANAIEHFRATNNLISTETMGIGIVTDPVTGKKRRV